MKVTHRQPVHQRFAEYQQFSEMRYFRFGERSTAAAILFGLFEELRLPLFQSLRKSICKQVDESTIVRNKRVLSFLLEPRVRPECLFAAWNYEELILDAVIEAVGQLAGDRGRQSGDVVEALRRKCPFQVVTEGAQPARNPMEIPTIYLNEADQCAILLYPERTMESFLVTKCRHIYVKSYILSWAKSLINRNSSLPDIEHISYPCEVLRCQKPIGLDIFDTANNSQIQPSSIYYDLILNYQEDTLEKYYREAAIEPPKCQYCGVRNAPCQCSARCRICIECALVAYCSYGYSFICPVCGERLSKELCKLLVDELPRRISWAPLPQFNASCDYCRQPVAIEDVKEISQEGKMTFACLACFAKEKPASDSPLAVSLRDAAFPSHAHFEDSMFSHSSSDSISFRGQSLPLLPFTVPYTGFINPPLGDFLEACLMCGRQSSCYTVLKSLRHDCWVCDDCIHALYDSKWVPACPACNTIVGGSVLKSIKQWGEAVNSLPWMNDTVNCSLCLQDKPRKDTTKSDRLAHNCTICNTCLLGFHSSSVCPKCLQTYSQQDKALLALFMPSAPSRTVSQTSSQFATQRICGECSEEIGRTHPRCPKSCVCSLCLLQNYVFTNSKKCPKCNGDIRGRLPDAVYCSNCSRQLVIEAESLDAVSGVCDSACVLCCFCIKISRGEATCQVCESGVETIEIGYITKWQKKFKLGCYCGKEKGAKIQMPCGCKAHSECFAKLKMCRSCGHEYKKKSQPRKLTSYFT